MRQPKRSSGGDYHGGTETRRKNKRKARKGCRTLRRDCFAHNPPFDVRCSFFECEPIRILWFLWEGFAKGGWVGPNSYIIVSLRSVLSCYIHPSSKPDQKWVAELNARNYLTVCWTCDTAHPTNLVCVGSSGEEPGDQTKE